MTLGVGVGVGVRFIATGYGHPRVTTSREVHAGHSSGVGRLPFMPLILTAHEKAPP